MSDVEKAKALFFEALSFMDALNFRDAEIRLRAALPFSPGSVSILTNLATVSLQLNKRVEAKTFAEQAIAANANNIEALLVLGDCYAKDSKLLEALDCFKKCIAMDRTIPEAYNNCGIVLGKLNRPAEALDAFGSAIALAPNYLDAYINRANALRELKRPDHAIGDYDKALALNPGLAEAWLGRGNALSDLKRHDEAAGAYNKALASNPGLADAWLGRGNVLLDLRRYDEALGAYDKALALDPERAEAWFACGNAFSGLRRHDEAFSAYDKALTSKPEFAEGWLGRGNVLFDLKRYEEAVHAYDRAVALKPGLAAAWIGRGNGLSEIKQYSEAIAAYDRALALEPNIAGAAGARLHTKMLICDWNNFDVECAQLIRSVADKKALVQPFQFLTLPSSLENQLQCAKLWVAKECPVASAPVWQGERYRHERIRVAYLSADFNDHATAHLMAGMFESHDRSRFEISAISWGPAENTKIRQRLKESFEHFVAVEAQSDDQIADLLKRSEIDILIDLKGFTNDARTGIFSRRPAPIQVNYLGYPGTMGATYIDYVVADGTLIPDSSRQYYSEKIVSLPNSYQVNDRKRIISDRAFTRAQLGLPPSGFVFCCFNNNYKITPDVFGSWMRIVRQVDGSVLWLLEDNQEAVANLKKEAAARGIDAERLIFANRVPLSDHLARHRLADLFLDTLPYNAHTTASDALWAGLPVLTLMGETFAGRVAGSLLNALQLPELIAATREAYEQMAIDFAKQPEKLAAIKQKLAAHRDTAPLFDTRLFTQHIEAAYTAMYEQFGAGLPPDHIVIPPD